MNIDNCEFFLPVYQAVLLILAHLQDQGLRHFQDDPAIMRLISNYLAMHLKD